MINNQQNSLIIGSMLGDGHLRKRKETWNSSLEIKRSQKDLNYAENQFEILKPLCTNKGFKLFNRFDKRTNKIYSSVSISTKSLDCFNNYYKDWYLNKKKIVPNNLHLDSLSIAIWLFDDGCIKRNNNRLEISFYTNAFSFEEASYLKDLLSNRYNETFLISNIRNQYYIRGGDSCAVSIAQDIKDYFYLLPRKSILLQSRLDCNMAKTRSKDKLKIFNSLVYMNEKKEFSLNEIAEKFDFYKNNEISSTLYSLLRRLIKINLITKANDLYFVNSLNEELVKYNKYYELNYEKIFV